MGSSGSGFYNSTNYNHYDQLHYKLQIKKIFSISHRGRVLARAKVGVLEGSNALEEVFHVHSAVQSRGKGVRFL